MASKVNHVDFDVYVLLIYGCYFLICFPLMFLSFWTKRICEKHQYFDEFYSRVTFVAIHISRTINSHGYISCIFIFSPFHILICIAFDSLTEKFNFMRFAVEVEKKGRKLAS